MTDVSRDEATVLAEEAVTAIGVASGDEFILIYDKTIEVGEGWVFFYNSREFIETGDLSSALAGNGPIFVDRSGAVRKLPSAVSWEVAIKNG